MAILFKDRFNYESLYKLALEIQEVYDSFLIEEFLASIMDKTWDNLEFKQRVTKISENLGKYLPQDYKMAIRIIDQVIINYEVCLDGFPSFFPTFVELYGQDKKNWDISMAALERYTKYATAEFAVRTFIGNDDKRMMAQMNIWARSSDEHVRRLASEGCRPRLPWGKALPNFQKNPTPVVGILEQLKMDPSLYVRKSVANNLNDISKTHPELVEKIAKEWYGKNPHTDWIVKHGCRTLLKNGNSAVFSIFGYAAANDIKINNFSLKVTTISIGENLTFSFDLEAKKDSKIRLEYGIDYRKANSKQNRKIFQISEVTFKDNCKKNYKKNHSFANTSTRKHYPGVHSITLIVNGIERDTREFEVLNGDQKFQ